MRVSNHCLYLTLLALIGVGCSDPAPPSFLVVDVVTDLAPGVDFNTVRLDVYEGATTQGLRPFEPISSSVRSSDSFSPAYRLLDDGEQPIAPGNYLAELTLSTGALRVDSQRQGFTVGRTTAISFNFSEGPACESPSDCGELLGATCSAVDCVGNICRCTCGGSADAGCDSVEICGNGIDDDGDSDVDCLDSDCEGRACDDGDPCTVSDICGSGLCNSQPKDCASANPCKIGMCDGSSGACYTENKADGALCDKHPNRCCNGTCVDLSKDAKNCGSCGVECVSNRCDDLGGGRAACYCTTNTQCPGSTVCYDPDGTGTAPGSYHCDCDNNSDCGSGAKCASNVPDLIDHCYYE